MNSLEKQVLQLIGESVESPDVFTPDDEGIRPIRDSLNAAIQEICMATGTYTATYHLPLYANRFFYRMGWTWDHYAWVLECWDHDRRIRLEPTDMETIRVTNPKFMESNGNPDRYVQIGFDILGFDRAPSAEGKVLELRCVAVPKAYSDDNSAIKVRDVFQRAAVLYAVSEFYASRGDAMRAKEFLDKYITTAGLAHMHRQQPERVFVMVREQKVAK